MKERNNIRSQLLLFFTVILLAAAGGSKSSSITIWMRTGLTTIPTGTPPQPPVYRFVRGVSTIYRIFFFAVSRKKNLTKKKKNTHTHPYIHQPNHTQRQKKSFFFSKPQNIPCLPIKPVCGYRSVLLLLLLLYFCCTVYDFFMYDSDCNYHDSVPVKFPIMIVLTLVFFLSLVCPSRSHTVFVRFAGGLTNQLTEVTIW